MWIVRTKVWIVHPKVWIVRTKVWIVHTKVWIVHTKSPHRVHTESTPRDPGLGPSKIQ